LVLTLFIPVALPEVKLYQSCPPTECWRTVSTETRY